MLLALLSPSKTLDFSDNVPKVISKKAAQPCFMQETQELIGLLKKYSAEDIAKLMDLSPKLSELNYQRFQDFLSYKNTKPALYAYKGDVYDGFELDKYSEDQVNFANKAIRIISGLYGVLKPLDLIVPYRLEMSIKLVNPQGKNLYEFWNEKLTDRINDDLLEADFVINLASGEYSSAINFARLIKPVINIVFKEKHKDGYKIIGLHAKKARGIMANFIVLNNIETPAELKNFKLNNYQFSQELSSAGEYVFIR